MLHGRRKTSWIILHWRSPIVLESLKLWILSLRRWSSILWTWRTHSLTILLNWWSSWKWRWPSLWMLHLLPRRLLLLLARRWLFTWIHIIKYIIKTLINYSPLFSSERSSNFNPSSNQASELENASHFGYLWFHQIQEEIC